MKRVSGKQKVTVNGISFVVKMRDGVVSLHKVGDSDECDVKVPLERIVCIIEGLLPFGLKYFA